MHSIFLSTAHRVVFNNHCELQAFRSKQHFQQAAKHIYHRHSSPISGTTATIRLTSRTTSFLLKFKSRSQRCTISNCRNLRIQLLNPTSAYFTFLNSNILRLSFVNLQLTQFKSSTVTSKTCSMNILPRNYQAYGPRILIVIQMHYFQIHSGVIS